MEKSTENIITRCLLLRRMIDHGYDIAFDSAFGEFEETFVSSRKDFSREELVKEKLSLLKLLC